MTQFPVSVPAWHMTTVPPPGYPLVTQPLYFAMVDKYYSGNDDINAATGNMTVSATGPGSWPPSSWRRMAAFSTAVPPLRSSIVHFAKPASSERNEAYQ